MTPSPRAVTLLALAVAGCASSAEPSNAAAGAAGTANDIGEGDGAIASSGGASGEGGGATAGGGQSSGGQATGGHSNGDASTDGHPAMDYPAGTWVNVTNNLTGTSTVCGNTYRIWAVPHQDKVLASVERIGLYATTDGGATWALQGGSTSPLTDFNGICFDPDHGDTYWVAGMHAGPGVSKTTDGGKTFATLGKIAGIDNIDADFTDPARKVMVAGVHERHQLYKTTDSGTSFTDVTSSFPAGDSFTVAPLVIDANTYVMGTSGGSAGSQGVFITTNGGSSWMQVSNVAVSGSGLKTSWGSLFYGSVSGGKVLRGSADGATWTTLSLPGALPYAIVVELPGRRTATTVKVNNVTAVTMSEDEGKTWIKIADKAPWPSWAQVGPYLTYDDVRGAFFIAYWDCGTTVRSDAVWRYDVMISP